MKLPWVSRRSLEAAENERIALSNYMREVVASKLALQATLDAIHAKRSAATAKGNRTRAALRRAG